MKKRLFIFFLLMLLCFPIKSNAVATNSSYSVKINLFLTNDCKDCEKEIEWLEEYRKDSFIDIEYINIDDSNELYDKVKEALTLKGDKMPLAIVGSNYFIGFNDKVKNNLTDAIKSYEKEDEYCDIVSKIRKGEDAKNCIEQNKDIYKQSSSYPIFIKIIVAIVVIGLVIGILLTIKKLLKGLSKK